MLTKIKVFSQRRDVFLSINLNKKQTRIFSMMVSSDSFRFKILFDLKGKYFCGFGYTNECFRELKINKEDIICLLNIFKNKIIEDLEMSVFCFKILFVNGDTVKKKVKLDQSILINLIDKLMDSVGE